jgi:hypothetical protein
MRGLRVQKFDTPCIPDTLKIAQGEFGLGNTIRIVDTDGEERVWFAAQIISLYFEENEEDHAAQIHEESRALWRPEREHSQALRELPAYAAAKWM